MIATITYSRPNRHCDFTVNIFDEDSNMTCLVEFWITSINSESNVEMLYSYNNHAHGKSKASYLVYKNDRLEFKHSDDRGLSSWGEGKGPIIERIKFIVNTEIEKALGLRDD